MRSKLLNLLFVLLSFLGSGNGFAQIKKLYLGNDTHTDLMWNGDEDFWYDLSYKMANFYLTELFAVNQQLNSDQMPWFHCSRYRCTSTVTV